MSSPPAVTDFNPASGSTAGSTVVVVNGTNFGFTGQLTIGECWILFGLLSET